MRVDSHTTERPLAAPSRADGDTFDDVLCYTESDADADVDRDGHCHGDKHRHGHHIRHAVVYVVAVRNALAIPNFDAVTRSAAVVLVDRDAHGRGLPISVAIAVRVARVCPVSPTNAVRVERRVTLRHCHDPAAAADLHNLRPRGRTAARH